jgi:uncharacterized FAD-dependent dehydrogenase
MEKVLKITGTLASMEGANVSALDEDNMEYYILMIEMDRDKERESCLKKRKSEKKKLENKLFNTLERQGLKEQGAIDHSAGSLNPASSISQSTSAGAPSNGSSFEDRTGSTAKKHKTDSSVLSLNYIESLTQDILKDLRSSSQSDIEDLAIERELKKAQIEAALSQKRFYDMQAMQLEQQMRVNSSSSSSNDQINNRSNQ